MKPHSNKSSTPFFNFAPTFISNPSAISFRVKPDCLLDKKLIIEIKNDALS